MKAIEAWFPCEIMISKHTPHGKKKLNQASLIGEEFWLISDVCRQIFSALLKR